MKPANKLTLFLTLVSLVAGAAALAYGKQVLDESRRTVAEVEAGLS